MYNCTKCFWHGTQLRYDWLGQGHCPRCNQVFVGCVSNAEYDRRMGKKSIATMGLSIIYKIYPIWVQIQRLRQYLIEEKDNESN